MPDERRLPLRLLIEEPPDRALEDRDLRRFELAVWITLALVALLALAGLVWVVRLLLEGP